MTAASRLVLLTILLVPSAVLAQSSDADHGSTASMLERLEARIETHRGALIAVRRDLHQHPEVSGQEERTAGIVAERLRRLGLTVRTGVGGHGVIATIEGSTPGPLVAVRADMDAVRSAAPDPVEFRSQKPGVRHICGHDIHTTVALALAEGLVAVRDSLAGSVMLIFQPAEETATGARAMIADGALEGRRPEAFFALHTAPLEVGQIGSRPERLLAGRDRAVVTLRGDGDLNTPARAITAAIDQLSSITLAEAVQETAEGFVLASVARNNSAGDDPRRRTIVATITASDDRRADVQATLQATVDAQKRDGIDAELTYETGWIAGVWNDPDLESRVRQTVSKILGKDALVPIGGIVPMFSEDFGAFLEDTPGVMVFLGVSNAAEGWVGMPHSPAYVADEEAIFIGARILAAFVFEVFDTSRKEASSESPDGTTAERPERRQGYPRQAAATQTLG